ncbi:MAG TPA: endonuclease/exonuclease/phosphatase family protein [Verrucomicrobiae bacterium]|nr:endonuclease/exonuclease/phosphatase family protein [Verrucomicrobiae bacterium]
MKSYQHVGTALHAALARLQAASLIVSALLCVCVAHCYFWRGDAYAAITIWPVWIWALPGLFLAGIGWRRSHRWSVLIVVAIWLLYLTCFSEEIWSLTRWRRWPSDEWQTARRRGEALRIVSINCAGGNPRAAMEVKAYEPDIVLLQESPERRALQEVAQQLFGTNAAVVAGPDASVIVRGQAIPQPLLATMRIHYTHAHVRLLSGAETDVISLRLPPAPLRDDLWTADCWRDYANDRQMRRRMLEALCQQIASTAHSVPFIIGGDFNTPGGDAIFRLFQPLFHDSFKEGGCGWGNTIVNEYPLLRIDQIWLSKQFHAVTTVARRTQNSDHRMVLCDALLKRKTQ